MSDKIIKRGLFTLFGALIILGLIYVQFRPQTASGGKHLTIQVTDNTGETTSYEVYTDAAYLREAMDQTEGLNYEGTEGPYGIMVTSVNGLTAVYEENGAYWAFYADGEYCSYSIDRQPVRNGETYSIQYTQSQ